MSTAIFSSFQSAVQRSPRAWALGAIAGGVLLWVQWPTLANLIHRWWTDPQYSHGYVVPAFAAFLLWDRRDKLDVAKVRPDWWGMPLLLAGLALRALGAYFYYPWFSELSVIPCLAGLVVLAGGRAALKWSWPSLVFLWFMVPLPFSFGNALGRQLQQIATPSSTFAFQTLGFTAFSQGNQIHLRHGPLNVAEACSGLSMLMVFIALAVAYLIVAKRPWIEQLIILSSAVPIALAANILRITLQGILQESIGPVAADFFHRWGGWVMMPFGLGLLWLALGLFNWVFPEKSARKVSGPRLAPAR